MTTKRFLATAALLATAMTCPGLARQPATQSGAKAAADVERPNIVFIFADDLGIGDIGPYGQTKIKTPNIDRLRREGMLMTNFYSGSAVCAPSRSSLMEGRSTAHTQVRSNFELGGFRDEDERGQLPLKEGTYTLPRMLLEAGYATGGFGKWGLGMNGTSGQPTRQGWNQFFGYLDQKQAHNYYPTHLWNNEQRYPLRNPFIHVHPKYAADQPVPLDEYKKYMGPDYADDAIVDQALKFIESNRAKRFFVYAALVQPHASLQVPDAEIDRFGYRKAFPETPYTTKGKGGGYTPHPIPRAARAAMISRLDADVGRMLALLDRLNLSSKTMVVFSSDNGASRAGGSDIDFFESTMKLRGEKRDLYEGGIRAPFVVRWPGRVKPGSKSDHVAAGWDLMATFADVAGTRLRSPTDGLSIVPTLTGKAGQQQHAHLYWESFENKPAQAVRMGNWKAVRRYRPTGGKNSPLQPLTVELYDLAKDERETTNVANAHRDVVARAEAVMAQRTRSPIAKWNFDTAGGAADPDEQ